MLDFNDTTTASIHVTATAAGALATPHAADTVSRTRDMTITGLLGHNTTRTWNGAGADTSSAYWADSAATRTENVSAASTFTDIVVTLPRSANPWPASGMIVRNATGTATVSKQGITRSLTVTRTVTITFNGTEFVPLTVGATAYTLDLATGPVTKNGRDATALGSSGRGWVGQPSLIGQRPGERPGRRAIWRRTSPNRGSTPRVRNAPQTGRDWSWCVPQGSLRYPRPCTAHSSSSWVGWPSRGRDQARAIARDCIGCVGHFDVRSLLHHDPVAQLVEQRTFNP